MGCEAGQCNRIFIVTPSLEGWPTKAKEAPSLDEIRLTPLDTYPVFQPSICLSKSPSNNCVNVFNQMIIHNILNNFFIDYITQLC